MIYIYILFNINNKQFRVKEYSGNFLVREEHRSTAHNRK